MLSNWQRWRERTKSLVLSATHVAPATQTALIPGARFSSLPCPLLSAQRRPNHGAVHRRRRSCLGRRASTRAFLLSPRGLRLRLVEQQSLARLHLTTAKAAAAAPRHLGRRGAPPSRCRGRRLASCHRDAAAWIQCESPARLPLPCLAMLRLRLGE